MNKTLFIPQWQVRQRLFKTKRIGGKAALIFAPPTLSIIYYSKNLCKNQEKMLKNNKIGVLFRKMNRFSYIEICLGGNGSKTSMPLSRSLHDDNLNISSKKIKAKTNKNITALFIAEKFSTPNLFNRKNPIQPTFRDGIQPRSAATPGAYTSHYKLYQKIRQKSR